MRILIVEDNPDHQIIIKKKLAGYYRNLDVDTASGFEDATGYLKDNVYDIILMDYRLKMYSGIDLINWINKRKIDSPIIMVTSAREIDIAVKAVKLGVYDYLCKTDESMERLPLLLEKVIEEYNLKKRLREAEFKYHTLVEGMNEAVFLSNGDGDIIFISSSVKRLLGYTEAEFKKDYLSYLSFRGQINGRELFILNLQKVLKGNSVEPFVVEFRRKDGKDIFVEINESLFIEDGDLKGVIGTLQDVTNRVLLEREIVSERKKLRLKGQETLRINKQLKRLIENLKNTREKLIQSEKLAALGKLVSGFAHELNNPLFVAMGNAELLLMDTATDDKQKEKLVNIIESVKRAKIIIDDLLRFARREKVEGEVIDINDVLKQTLALRQYDLSVGGIKVELEFSKDVPFIHGNFIRLQQVFLNILNNAEQAIGESGKKGLIGIRSIYDEREERVLVELRDNGKGIPDELIGKVFDPFFTTREVGKGTGLGLSTSYGIIQDHGGDIRVKSDKEWTTFAVSLPRYGETQGEVESAKKTASKKSCGEL